MACDTQDQRQPESNPNGILLTTYVTYYLPFTTRRLQYTSCGLFIYVHSFRRSLIPSLVHRHPTTDLKRFTADLQMQFICFRFLKWDDAPCDLNSVGGIKVLCEVESRWSLPPQPAPVANASRWGISSAQLSDISRSNLPRSSRLDLNRLTNRDLAVFSSRHGHIGQRSTYRENGCYQAVLSDQSTMLPNEVDE